jgi:hypothetical protein
MWRGRRIIAAKWRVSRTVREGRRAVSSWTTYDVNARMTLSVGDILLKRSSPE